MQGHVKLCHALGIALLGALTVVPVMAQPQQKEQRSYVATIDHRRTQLKERLSALEKQRQYDVAIGTAGELLELEERTGDSADAGIAASRLARCEELVGRYEEAEAHRALALERFQQAYLAGHWRVVNARVAWEYCRFCRSSEPQVQEQLRKATRLTSESTQHFSNEEARESYEKAQEALRIRRELLGEDHHLMATSLRRLAFALGDLRRFRDADQAIQRAIEIRSTIFGAENPLTGDAHLTAGLIAQMGRLQGELTHLETGVRILRSTYGDGHSETAEARRITGLAYFRRGNYAAAYPHLHAALKGYERARGENHPRTLAALSSLAITCQPLRRYAEALLHFQRLLESNQTRFGDGSPQVARTLIDLGEVYGGLNRYSEAVESWEQALAIAQKNHHVPTTAAVRQKLGLRLMSEGKHAEAKSHLQECLRLVEVAYGPQSGPAASAHHSLGQLYTAVQMFEQSTQHYRAALQIREKYYPPGHKIRIDTMLELGRTLGFLKDFDAARKTLGEALSQIKSAEGSQNQEYVRALIYLGGLLRQSGELALAKEKLSEAAQLEEGTFDQGGIFLRQSLLNELARLAHAEGDRSAVHTSYFEFLQTSSSAFVVQALAASEAEAMWLRRRLQTHADVLLANLMKATSIDDLEAYRLLSRTRGIVSREITQRQRIAASDDTLAGLQQELAETRRLLSQTYAASSANSQNARQRLAALESRKIRLERQLAGRTLRARAALSDDRPFVAEVLPENTVLIEFMKYRTYWDPEHTAKYAAFVAARSRPDGDLVLAKIDLGEAEPIERWVDAWRRQLRDARDRSRGLVRELRPQAGDPAAQLRELLWAPCEPHLDSGQTLIIIPDGDLWRVPWSALPGKQPGSFLIEDYQLVTSSYGQLVTETLNREAPGGGSLLAVGDVAYDEADPAPLPAAQDSQSRVPAQAPADREAWRPLPHTGEEVAAILNVPGAPAEAIVLRGSQAEEAALRKQMHRAAYIHVATHGLFSPETFRSATAPAEQDDPFTDPATAFSARPLEGHNPLLLSGLVLAGANVPPATDPQGLPLRADGILTGEEVIDLDLSETELVVLSACETGLGKVAGGEGVYGLQRAFRRAGARSVVASLWQVDDAATKALMVEFYRNLWQRELSKGEALRQAQLALMRGGLYSPPQEPTDADAADSARLAPHFWAAWQLSGDWR